MTVDTGAGDGRNAAVNYADFGLKRGGRGFGWCVWRAIIDVWDAVAFGGRMMVKPCGDALRVSSGIHPAELSFPLLRFQDFSAQRGQLIIQRVQGAQKRLVELPPLLNDKRRLRNLFTSCVRANLALCDGDQMP